MCTVLCEEGLFAMGNQLKRATTLYQDSMTIKDPRFHAQTKYYFRYLVKDGLVELIMYSSNVTFNKALRKQ